MQADKEGVKQQLIDLARKLGLEKAYGPLTFGEAEMDAIVEYPNEDEQYPISFYNRHGLLIGALVVEIHEDADPQSECDILGVRCMAIADDNCAFE